MQDTEHLQQQIDELKTAVLKSNEMIDHITLQVGDHAVLLLGSERVNARGIVANMQQLQNEVITNRERLGAVAALRGDIDRVLGQLSGTVASNTKAIADNATMIQAMIRQNELKEARDQASAEALERFFSAIKLWGGLAGALLGISQLANIIINLSR